PQGTARGQRAAEKGKVNPPQVPGVLWHEGLTYHRVGKDTLTLDVARPERGEGPFPAVIFLHGMIGQGKPGVVPLAKRLAQKGYVGVAVAFRHRPEQPFPGAIEDAKCAIRWLRAHARKYRIDPDRIGVVGYSAGGGLACLLGLA